MDDIEIAIKISEKEYNSIKENKYGVFGGRIFEAIRNGRPLSEEKINEERWIPVTEGYPIKGVDVLVCNSFGYISTCFLDWCNRWCVSEGDAVIANDLVIAWMPLPESYKPESEVEK